MKKYLTLIAKASKQHWILLILISVGFLVFYYSSLLMLTMLRFGEIPNYVEFYDVFYVYGLIFKGTPSLMDAIPILLDEAWFEAGYKNPMYYGIATWSFVLIPAKMLLVFLMGILLGIFTILVKIGRTESCQLKTDTRLYTAAGISTVFISLTSATLTWVVCCATPSWVVALAMLGMSASLALWLEPLGNILTLIGLLVMIWIIYSQLKSLSKENVVLT